MSNTTLTQERLQEVLDYNESTGVFIWKVDKSINVKKGRAAGCVSSLEGRRRIQIDHVTYTEAQVAWVYAYGTLPPSRVFHLDGDPSNNAIANLSLTAPPQRKGKPHNKLTQDELFDLLHYCPKTGIWTWVEQRCNSVPAGSVAGSIDKRGNRRILVLGLMYSAARLSYLYINGAYPTRRVYRVDGDNANDRWDNLTTVNPMLFGKPRKVVKASTKPATKAQQDAESQEAAAWKDICNGSEPPPPLVTEVPGGVANRTAQWVWFEATKPADCLVPHNEQVEPPSLAKVTLFNAISERLWAVLK